MPGADFNGDGYDDLLWRDVSGLVTDWLGTANGTFLNNHAKSAVLVPTDWQVVGLGDFNGDGFSDVLWRHDGGLVTDWLGRADGSFANNHANSATFVPSEWRIVGTGDFNGDGYGDVLWRHDGGLITNWLGTASGGFVNNHVNSAKIQSNSWVVSGVGDFNGDGRSDILWQDGDFAKQWLGTASGGFDSNEAGVQHLRPLASAIGDFNGDGRDDIAIVDDWSFASIFLARPDGSFDTSDYDPFADAAFRGIDTAGDFNGDGADDILWREGPILTMTLGVIGPHPVMVDNPHFIADVPTTWQVQPNLAGLGMWDY